MTAGRKPRLRMLLVVLAAILLLGFAGRCRSQTLDSYGGREDVACMVRSHAWHAEQIGDRWWICTPEGHGFFVQDVDLINQTDAVAEKKIVDKYGSVYAWSDAALQRLRAWGFNTIGVYAYQFVLPVATDATGRSFHKITLPFMEEVRPSFYSMRNPPMHTSSDIDVRFLTEPVKNILGARSIFYRDYVPGGGVGDYFDPKMETWLGKDMSQDFFWNTVKSSRFADFLLGITGDDGDEMYGFMSGPDFSTTPPGKNNPNLSLLILTESPVQTANPTLGFIYQDSTMYTKVALRNMLEMKYKTIAALNAAWGSDYTSFDSSGTPISGERIGMADGLTLAFHHRLEHPHPSRYSLEITVSGAPVGGDTGDGMLYGPNVTGTVNYESGLVQFAFKPGHAPRSNAVVGVSYVEDGWGIGTGLMDEDMRPAHRAWLGNSWNGFDPISGPKPQKMNTRVRADLDTFLEQTADWYFKMLRDGIHAEFPKALVLAQLGSWDGVPPAPVLRAAQHYLDLFEDDESRGSFDKPRLDFIARNYGNRPFLSGVYLAANSDSALANAGGAPDAQFVTQQDKGNAYVKAVSSFLSSRNSLGVNPHVGFLLWSWMDMWSESTNWGLVSHLDNAYDGHEDVRSTVPCSPPLQRYTCGGEPSNYGNYVGAVKQANSMWLTIPRANAQPRVESQPATGPRN